MRAGAAASVTAALAAAVAGCGLGAGERVQGDATLRVTRDYGSELVAEAALEDPTPSETVIRALDREAEIETRYGGGFVDSIDGISGGVGEGRSFDWFFYVNGVESSLGAAEVAVRPGDRIWWDYRDWTDAMRVPAVVGSWPQPFAGPWSGQGAAVRVECATGIEVCQEAADRLATEGVETVVSIQGLEGEHIGAPARMLVGAWPRIREDGAARRLDEGPAASGVFASFEESSDGGWELNGLDPQARPAIALGPGAGLVAAVRHGEEEPAWLITGTDEEGVAEAVELLDSATLRDHYAVATEGEEPTGLPVIEGMTR